MKEKILLFVISFLVAACSLESIETNAKYKTEDNDDWSIISKIESERWNKKDLISNLGVPHKRNKEKNEMSEFLIYNYIQSNHQKWGFEIDEKGNVISITFIPNISNNENFTLEKIAQKWGASCVKKKEVDSSQHFVRNIYYLDCGKKRRAYFNRYDEVTSLAVDVL